MNYRRMCLDIARSEISGALPTPTDIHLSLRSAKSLLVHGLCGYAIGLLNMDVDTSEEGWECLKEAEAVKSTYEYNGVQENVQEYNNCVDQIQYTEGVYYWREGQYQSKNFKVFLYLYYMDVLGQ
jgi:hypothetical protein